MIDYPKVYKLWTTSLDQQIRKLNILEIYISNHHRSRMDVQFHAFEDHNRLVIVNIEDVNTFDVETYGKKDR